MDNFYDINDYVVYLIKKWKVCLGIIVATVVLFAGIRAISLLQDYKNQQNNSVTLEQNSSDKKSESAEPMWNRVQQIIKVEAVQNDNASEIVAKAFDSYRQLGSSEKLLNMMYEKWYEEEKKEDVNRKKLLSEYGYILDKEKEYPYVRKDFYDQFLIDGNGLVGLSKNLAIDNKDEQYISVGFMSTNEKLARKISQDYADELTKLVNEQLNGITCKVIDTSVLYELPMISSSTLQTTRVLKQASVTNDITIAMIIKQTVKGIVWGGILGVLISAIVVFLMYMMTRKINILNDLKKTGLPIAGIGFKNGTHRLKARMFSVLEGNQWSRNMDELIERINLYLPQEESSIFILSTSNQEICQIITEKLNAETKSMQYVCEKENSNCTKIMLVEEFGVSLKNEVYQKIKQLESKNIEILGIVGIE